MRVWRNAQGDLLTDEQLARHIAAFGSLSRALEAGDIQLVVSTGTDGKPVADQQGAGGAGRRRAHAALSSYL